RTPPPARSRARPAPRPGRARASPQGQYGRSRRLEPEEPLDLVPDHDCEPDAGRDPRRQREPEAQPREVALVGPLLPVAALDPLAAVVPRDRRRVEQLLLDALSLRQSHARSLVGHTWGGRKMAVARETT